MKVKNINGTAFNTCKCGPWIDHWIRFSGQGLPVTCPVTACDQPTAVGAHVQRDSVADRSWYIVPLCAKCNGKKGQSLVVDDRVKLVSANVSETCEQPQSKMA